ncbi:endo-1,4-beta-xylanase 1-like isoform X2 [Haliotis rufescens]|uniref:endo-1,4-beta-xylanase 1-like isoform X2 n=1 Tax=Haliotis rufescens TaxID=6454 RepID=UPI00201F72BF|nr:endo-1,4-beta-xylanase 1-like isoform X2 [Haliotis rufescens]
MSHRSVLVLLLTVAIGLAFGEINLLKNADFELSTFSESSGAWYANGCSATASDDSYTGAHSVRVTNRRGTWAGMSYHLTLKPGTNYYFKAHIKLQNVPTHDLTANTQVMVFLQMTSGSKYLTLSENKVMQPHIWQAIGGDFTTPADLTSARLYIQSKDASVNYLLDSSSLVEIPPLPINWKTTANATIDKMRKADITVSIYGHSSTKDLIGVTIEVIQNKHEFGFGSAVKASAMTNPQETTYQKVFYDNFEWATIENFLKWRMMEWTEGKVNYATAMNAVDEMLKHGTNIRAHNLFWDRKSNVPAWLANTTGQALIQQMERRINGIVPRTKGKVEHWDVNNENIHGNFFESGTGDVNITMWMFKEVHKVDPTVKLFLNDYGVVKDRYSTQDYYNQAMMFKARPDVPLYGLGIQAHMHSSIDVSVVKYRLDQMVATGLPLWITEFDLDVRDDNSRADYLEDLLTLFFSTPEVEGIIFWGFWDGNMHAPIRALFTGSDVKPNAAGRRYQQLFKRDWRTNITTPIASGHASLRGFRGQYTLRVTKAGHTLKEEKFTLTSKGADLNVTVSGSGNTMQVSHILVG